MGFVGISPRHLHLFYIFSEPFDLAHTAHRLWFTQKTNVSGFLNHYGQPAPHQTQTTRLTRDSRTANTPLPPLTPPPHPASDKIRNLAGLAPRRRRRGGGLTHPTRPHLSQSSPSVCPETVRGADCSHSPGKPSNNNKNCHNSTCLV
jgi:hypothetical protein